MLPSYLDRIRQNQAYPLRMLKTVPQKIVRDAERVGLIDTTEIATVDGRRELFAFTPHFYGVGLSQHTGDVFDEVKLFVSSIIYGHRFADIRIKEPTILIEALLNKGAVGPATPIGRDYPLIETAGIVKVEKSNMYPDRYYMKLVKADVVAQSLEVLKTGFLDTVSKYKHDPLSGLYVPNEFQGPEQYRSQLQPLQPSQASELARERVIRAMRGEEFR